MKGLIILALVGAATCAPSVGPYVWDLQKPRMDAAAVAAMLSSRDLGQYPTYAPIPQTSFDCKSKKAPGFYADVETQCQVYHRCDQNGDMKTFICTNMTVFDQVTLVCDYWFNVDCSRTAEFEDFANRRLYQQELPLFDTPPEGYVAPQGATGSQQTSGGGNVAPAKPVKPAQARGGNKGQVSAKANAGQQGSGSVAQASGKRIQVGGSASMSGANMNGQQHITGDANAQASNADESAAASETA